MGRNRASKNRLHSRASLTPTTPRGHTTDTTRSEISAQDSESLLPISPTITPPTSPSSTPMMLEPTISVNDIISTDIVDIAEMFATMKKAMLMMTSAFEQFEIQTEQLASLSLDIKAANQVRPSICNRRTWSHILL